MRRFDRQGSQIGCGSTQPFSAVSAVKILVRTDGDNAGGVNLVVSHIVMPLDVVEIHRAGDAVILVEVFQVTKQVCVIGETPDIALKMSVVDSIEADECHEQAPIGFDDARPKQITLSGQTRI